MKGLFIFITLMMLCTISAAFFTSNSYTVTVYEDENCQKEFQTMVLPNNSPKTPQEDFQQVCTKDGASFVRSGGACVKPDVEEESAGAVFAVWDSPQCFFFPKFHFNAISDNENVYGECLKAKFAFGMNPSVDVSARILSCANPDAKAEIIDSDDLTIMAADDIVKSFNELNVLKGGASAPATPSFPFPSFPTPPSQSQPGNPGQSENAGDDMMAGLAQLLMDAMNAAFKQGMAPDQNKQ